MDRPSRNRKSVNYSDFQDDDEDFASVKPPPKKARPAIKDADAEGNCKTTSPSPNETDVTSSANRSRVSLDAKRYERDLEAALTLSLLDTSKTDDRDPGVKTDECSAGDCDRAPQCSPPVLIHCSADGSHSVGDGQPCPDSPPVLSNCSIDSRSLGLNLISVDASPPGVSKQTKASKKLTKPLKEKKNNIDDDDYRPQNAPDSESDADFTEGDESEDETFTVKKKKTVTQKTEKKATLAAKDKKEKKEKKPAKVSKAKGSAPSPAVCRSPAPPVSGLKKTPTTPPVSKPALCSSPAGDRLPKWNPPGLVGRSPNQNAPLKSPGQGLRLGLSRLARVKPLHPNVAAN